MRSQWLFGSSQSNFRSRARASAHLSEPSSFSTLSPLDGRFNTRRQLQGPPSTTAPMSGRQRGHTLRPLSVARRCWTARRFGERLGVRECSSSGPSHWIAYCDQFPLPISRHRISRAASGWSERQSPDLSFQTCPEFRRRWAVNRYLRDLPIGFYPHGQCRWLTGCAATRTNGGWHRGSGGADRLWRRFRLGHRFARIAAALRRCDEEQKEGRGRLHV